MKLFKFNFISSNSYLINFKFFVIYYYIIFLHIHSFKITFFFIHKTMTIATCLENSFDKQIDYIHILNK